MIWADALMALLVAVFFTALLVGVMRWRHPGQAAAAWSGVVFLLVLFFLAIWAGGAWARPVEPAMFGTAWIPFVITGFFVALVIVAVATPVKPRTPDPVDRLEAREAEAAVAVFGVFFWVLLAALAAAVAAAYLL